MIASYKDLVVWQKAMNLVVMTYRIVKLLPKEEMYALSDQIKFSLGAWIFLPGPEKDGKYGALKDLSSIFVKARFSF